LAIFTASSIVMLARSVDASPRSDMTWRAVRRRRSKMRTSMLRSAGSRPAGLCARSMRSSSDVWSISSLPAGSTPRSRVTPLAALLSIQITGQATR
jgi:hypothetical protein